MFSSGQFESAGKWFQLAIDRGEFRVYLNLGLSRLKLGHLQSAEISLRSGADHGDIDSSYELALLLEDTDREDEAHSIHLALAESGYAESQLSLAWYANDRGDRAAANIFLVHLVSREDEVGAVAAGMIGYEYYSEGRLAEAEPLLRRGSMCYPSALVALIQLLTRTGRTQEARALARSADANGVEGAAQALALIGEHQ
jgi:tetratricopeptide (TPR) repeat protein